MVAGALLVAAGGFNLNSVSTPSTFQTDLSRTPIARTGFQGSFQGFPFNPRLSPALAPIEPEAGEDPDGRGDWFMFQRTYPSNSIPPDARRRAWEAQTDYQISSLVSPQASTTWRSIGPKPTASPWYDFWGPTSGRVNAVAVSPVNSRIVLVGSSTGGIWRSIDGGETFVPVSDDQADLTVGSIAFSKSNPSIAYAGMGDTKGGYLGSGVLKSTDEGTTWTLVSNSSLPSPGSIAKLEIDPADPNRVYVAQYSRVSGDKVTSSGVYFSNNGGVNWTKAFAGAPRDVVIDPGDSRTIYAGLSRIDKDADPAFGVYRSTDSGSTWVNLLTAPQYELSKRRDVRVAISPIDRQKIYAYFGGFLFGNLDVRLKASTDAGATWTELSLAGVDLAQFGYNTFLIADPHDAHTLYLGSRDLYKSTDAGGSWVNISGNYYNSGAGFTYAPGGSNTHPDQHALGFSADPNEFYLGNDGGVSKTTDGGRTFRSMNATLTLTQFVGIALHPINPGITFGGSQDNGAQQRWGDVQTWYELVTGDGGHVVINPLDPSMVFLTYVRGEIYRFVAEGRALDVQVAYNGSFGEFAATPRMAFYPPFVGNGVDSTLYFGTWRLFISNDLGNFWFAPAGFFDLTKGITNTSADVLSAIGVSRSNTNVIYTGSAQGRAMLSTNRGQSWTDITRGLPDRFITSIVVDPANSATAYLTVSGFNSGHIFKTTDTGSTWADISGGLPDIPANALLIDPLDPDTIYAATDVGVFRSRTRGASWRAFNKGMPPVVVQEFTSQPSGLIQVATYGRGAFELLGNQPPVIASASFDGKKRLTISGTAFGEEARVLINDQDKSHRINTDSDAEITLVGKSKKLGLRPGGNTIQIITSDNLNSNVFTITL